MRIISFFLLFSMSVIGATAADMADGGVFSCDIRSTSDVTARFVPGKDTLAAVAGSVRPVRCGDRAEVYELSGENLVRLTLPGSFSVVGGSLRFDYYIPSGVKVKYWQFSIRQKGENRTWNARSAAVVGHWANLDWSFAEIIGGDTWIMWGINEIKDLSISLVTAGKCDAMIGSIELLSGNCYPNRLPEVIRSTGESREVSFRKSFRLNEVDPAAWAQVIATDSFELIVNGTRAASGGFSNVDHAKWPSVDWGVAREAKIGRYLRTGENTVEIRVSSPNGRPRVACVVGWSGPGKRTVLVSDNSWNDGGRGAISLGPVPGEGDDRWKGFLDIYPLLLPECWNPRIRKPASVVVASVGLKHSGPTAPRIVPGKWRVKKEGKRWTMIDPGGKPFFLIGTQNCALSPGYNYRFYRNALDGFDSEAAWADHMVEQMKSLGINCLTVTMPDSIYESAKRHGIPSFRYLPSEAGGPFLINRKGARLHLVADPFDPGWRRRYHDLVTAVGKKWGADPSVIGLFVNNEMQIDGALNGGTAVGYVYSEACGREFIRVLREKYRSIDALNRSWYGGDTKKYHRSFENILTDRPDPADGNRTEDVIVAQAKEGGVRNQAVRTRMMEDFQEFAVYTIRTYADYILREIRTAMPDKLVASNRFMGRASAEMLAVWKDYDLIAWNSYPMWIWGRGTYGGVQLDAMRLAEKMTGRPMIISEYNVQALDSKLPNPSATLETQKQRGDEFCGVTKLICRELPFVVGVAQFGWQDSPDGERQNWGVMDGRNELYCDYVNGMIRTVNGIEAWRKK